jgi:hypothetical protein
MIMCTPPIVRPDGRTAYAVLACLLLLTGCVNIDGPSNLPSIEKIRVLTSAPNKHSIQIHESAFPLDENGRANVAVPQFGMHCQLYLFGVLKVNDYSPYKTREIEVLTGDKVIKRLSLDQLSKLPTDDAGYHLVPIKK